MSHAQPYRRARCPCAWPPSRLPACGAVGIKPLTCALKAQLVELRPCAEIAPEQTPSSSPPLVIASLLITIETGDRGGEGDSR